MTYESLIFAATCDIAGKVRGKAFPAAQLDKRLQRGVGWTPTNVQITCFDTIAESPFGALGDLLLIPDDSTDVILKLPDGKTERFMLGDISDLNGNPWNFCTRSILKSALGRLDDVAGLNLLSAFEHEFQLKEKPAISNQGYGREGFELQRDLCELLMTSCENVGLNTDSIMKEYGPNQFEIVVGPKIGVTSADEATILRELTRSCARIIGQNATYTPIRDVNNVGNGVHIHMSLLDQNNEPVGYDERSPYGMSKIMGSFAAGILKYLPNIVALTAPSVISYERLTPHRWSAAYNNLGFRDREASLRVCPVTAKEPQSIAEQFNIEYRAADAAACPHLALAAIIHAGTQGIEDNLPTPTPTEEDLSLLPPDELAERGFERLPTNLEEALAKFSESVTATGWFPDQFSDVYVAHKKAEIEHVSEMSVEERCAAYEETY